MKISRKHIVFAFLVSIGFLGLFFFGWNPYTGLLFVLTMFIVGTSIPKSYRGPESRMEQILSGLQTITVLGAASLAAWLAGKEVFHRILRHPGFLLLLWAWVQLVLAERLYCGKNREKSQQG